MELLDAIRLRASTRAFLDRPVERPIVEAILEVARWAPSGGNLQPWEVAVVTGASKERIGREIVAAREAGQPEEPDYAYYPRQWREPFKGRRLAAGLSLYRSLGIGREDQAARKEAWNRNYHFFRAPVGLLIFIDRSLGQGAFIDAGIFMQNVMLAALHYGLATCPEASMSEYPEIVRKELGIPGEKLLVGGIALGYPDHDAPVNGYRTTREPVEGFTRWFS